MALLAECELGSTIIISTRACLYYGNILVYDHINAYSLDCAIYFWNIWTVTFALVMIVLSLNHLANIQSNFLSVCWATHPINMHCMCLEKAKTSSNQIVRSISTPLHHHLTLEFILESPPPIFERVCVCVLIDMKKKHATCYNPWGMSPDDHSSLHLMKKNAVYPVHFNPLL